MADFSMSPEDEARIKSWVEAELEERGDAVTASGWWAACVPGDTSSPAPAVVTEAQVTAALEFLIAHRHEPTTEALARKLAEAVVRAR